MTAPRCPNHPDMPMVATLENKVNAIMKLRCPVCGETKWITEDVWKVLIKEDTA